MNKKINELLDEIKHKELVLPEFQREYDWNKSQVRKLFESLYRNYPTGSLLIWVTDDPPKIKNDAYDLEKVRRVNVLLDGQQRLTSIYIHRYGEVPPYYSKEEISDSYFDLYFNVMKGEFKYYKKLEMKNNPYWIKLQDLFNKEISAFELIEQDDDLEDQEEQHDAGKKVDNNITKIKNILTQDYPIQKVPNSADIKEAVKVFDLVNSQGTPLTTADIVLAHMTSQWPDVRRVLKEKIQELKEESFDFDLKFMTRCLVGVATGEGNLENFGESSKKELKEGWKKLDKVLDYLVSFLKNKAHIVSTKDLSSPNVLVPLVVYLSRKGWFEGSEEDKFLYWMYAALYQGRYTTSTDTYLQQDISALLEEPKPETLITALKEDEGSPEVSAGSLELRGVRNSLYNMMNIVIRSKGAVDWSNGLPLKENVGRDFRIERHHIFPKSVLEDNGWESGRSLSEGKKIHEIANRIPLTRSGNMDIFDKKPAEYLPIVDEKYPGTLEASLIPKNEKLWKVDNYEMFLEQRREMIAEAINDYMEGLLLDEGSEEFKVKDLLDKEEDDSVEFKARLRAGDREDGGYFLEDAAMKAVAGFLNSEGGYLLIGIDDDGGVVGIEDDYETLGKSNRDGFTLYLTDLIEGKIGSDVLPLIDINIEEVDGRDVCLVEVKKSSKPTYLKKDNSEKFYVRMQNSTRELEGAEMDSFKEERFNS